VKKTRQVGITRTKEFDANVEGIQASMSVETSVSKVVHAAVAEKHERTKQAAKRKGQ